MAHFTLRSRRDRVRNAANNWRRQYGEQPTDIRWRRVLKDLDALDLETADPAEVDAIIGNESWTTEICSVCQSDAGEVWIEFEAWDERQVMCSECLERASDLLRVKA